MNPPTLSAAKSLTEQGVMFALSLLVVWALAMGVFILTKWALAKIKKDADAPKAPRYGEGWRCRDCLYAEELRDPKDLVQHRLFGFLRLARAVMIPNLPIPDAGRRAVFQDLQDIKFRVVGEMLLGWLRDNLDALPEMAGDTLCSECLGLIGRIVESYEGEATAKGIPAVVLTRFRQWHGARIVHLQSEIRLVCESEWISSPTERVGFILSIFEQVMKATVLDAERTQASLNGSLTGLVYRGITLGPCQPREGGSGSFKALPAR